VASIGRTKKKLDKQPKYENDGIPDRLYREGLLG
jgi:hypothetical protein